MRPLSGIFPATEYPNLIIGLDAPDDAAVYRLDDERAIISTTDFFPPVVDDYYAFGAIAAANALSDIYAMGGEPLMAINLAAFPDGLDMSILAEILRGGAEKVREAGAVIAGGHTVADKEPKYGLAVTGQVNPKRVIRKRGAQPGDVLILTKALGTGVITTALKQGKATSVQIATVTQGMSHLNKLASEVVRRFNDQQPTIRAMTDITGFGLIGHAHEMAHLSAVAFTIHIDALPWYPGALELAQADVFPGGMARNSDYFSGFVSAASGIESWELDLLYDPQTSGGLLISTDEKRADAVLQALKDAGETSTIVGYVTDGMGELSIVR